MPIGSIASIMHRITGVLLALGIPYAIYLLDLSLRGPQGYVRVISIFDMLAFKGLAILFIWALTYHLLAGVRHLLSDIDIGSHLHTARFTAWLVNGIAAFVVVLSIGAVF